MLNLTRWYYIQNSNMYLSIRRLFLNLDIFSTSYFSSLFLANKKSSKTTVIFRNTKLSLNHCLLITNFCIFWMFFIHFKCFIIIQFPTFIIDSSTKSLIATLGIIFTLTQMQSSNDKILKCCQPMRRFRTFLLLGLIEYERHRARGPKVVTSLDVQILNNVWMQICHEQMASLFFHPSKDL